MPCRNGCRACSTRRSRANGRSLRQTCITTFPASAIKQPELPAKPLDAMLQCNALAEFLRKALADQGATYGEAANAYGSFIDKLDTRMSVAVRAAGLRSGDALRARKAGGSGGRGKARPAARGDRRLRKEI